MDDFWRKKRLGEMSQSEWEALCDGCGRCCLVKLRDEDDEELVYYTDAACAKLDLKVCQCTVYNNRQALVSDCVTLSADNLATITWLPPTCAYRRLSEGRDLAWWHPLISGTYETVREAGISVSGRAVSEAEIHDHDLEEHIVTWPLQPDQDPPDHDQ